MVILPRIAPQIPESEGSDSSSGMVILQRMAPQFGSCAEAEAAGYGSMRFGKAGYRPGLDADNDGIACEPFRR